MTFPIISADSHITEPPSTYVDRIDAKFRDRAPHVVHDPKRGDLFVRFSGGIAPTALPRDRLAPIAVRIEGTVKTLSGSTPPVKIRAASPGPTVPSNGRPAATPYSNTWTMFGCWWRAARAAS